MTTPLDRVSSFYQRVLFESPLGKSALDYLYERGFTDETLKAYEVGFSPSAVVDYIAIKALSFSDLTKLEDIEHLFKLKNGSFQDKFSGRITFPLKTCSNRTLGFAAREIDGTLPKYLNSTESSEYHKARCLYGIQVATEAIFDSNYAILCEGYTDAMAFHQVGQTMAVACGGTHATQYQLALIGRYTMNLVLAFDADDAGDGVTDQTTALAKKMGFKVARLDTERGKDPAEVLLSK
jgi:DNA primase